MSDAPNPDLGDVFTLDRREQLYRGFVTLDAYYIRQRRFDGGWSPVLRREVVVAREAVAVLLYDPVRDVVVLVQQARLPAAIAGFSGIQTEIVAGLIEPGEQPEAVASREVMEETGCRIIGAPIEIVDMAVTPGHSTERVHVYCARVDATNAGGLHGVAAENEDIRVLVMPARDFIQASGNGRIANAFTIIASLWLRAERDRLRRDWAQA